MVPPNLKKQFYKERYFIRLLHKHNFNIATNIGIDLLSQGTTPQVPWALTSLTAGFGMGPGVRIIPHRQTSLPGVAH